MIIDFRSDTVTQPSPGMLEAMHSAKLGDDVFGEDPSINELQDMAANLFGMEAALFCPSGTMTNQIGIKCHVQPGDEVICDESSHVYQYEGGGIASNSGASVKLLYGDRGRITAAQVLGAINPDDAHRARTSLVSLENTSNRGGGSCYDFADILSIKEVCQQHGLGFHLDGARLWNALVKKKETALQYGSAFDSISVCLSKGLGCPVGSLLLGKKSFIKKAHRFRKAFGGGMRQAGSLAAAGVYALKNNITRLEQDHLHAQALVAPLLDKKIIREVLPVETNIVIFELKDEFPAVKFVDELKNKDILAYAIAPNRVRFVVHLDISPVMIDQTISILSKI